MNMKISPRISESCPIQSEYVHNVSFAFLSHQPLLSLINTHENNIGN